MLGLRSLGESSPLSKPYDGSDSVDLASLDLAVSGLAQGQTLVGDLKLQDLRVRLQKAVADEAFVAAGTLRHEIRGLE